MRIILTGTGISQGIPVIGCPCEACRSTDPLDKRLRTAALVQEGDTNVAIDIGPDFRQQMMRAEVTALHAVVITHEHSDHVAGLDDVRPFNFTMRCEMPLYAEPRVLKALAQRFPYAFAPPEQRYPGAAAFDVRPIQRLLQPLDVAGLPFLPFRVMHGRLPITGYRVRDFAYITDCSALPEESLAALRGLEVLVLNTLRYRPHPMHLTLAESLAIVERLQPRRAFFTHVSHELGPHRNVRDLPPNVRIAYDGMVIDL
ncbi:MAG: hypothetical protein CSA07_00540 [Bacteroidia bacterium]|nr:MAG: hypothetical protein CSA07_00540 [Bacteroidia bacterium]